MGLGSGLPPEIYGAWIEAVRRLYPEADTDEEAVAKLTSDAKAIYGRMEPYLRGAGQEFGDPVEWAEQVTRQASDAYMASHSDTGPPAPAPEKRVAPLSRPRRRYAGRPPRRTLRALLRAAKGLRTRLRRHA